MRFASWPNWKSGSILGSKEWDSANTVDLLGTGFAV